MSHLGSRSISLVLPWLVACAPVSEPAPDLVGAAATGETSAAEPSADMGVDDRVDVGSGESTDTGEGEGVPAQPPGAWIAIPPGSFTMGAQASDPCPVTGGNDVAHPVTLTAGFEISATEVTWAQYAAVVGEAHPWATDCDDCPLAMVTWHDAAAVCNAYSELAGLPTCYACTGDGADRRCTVADSPRACEGYRLPTEAEWEYAARAGETAVAHGGPIEICSSADARLDTLGWYLYNADGGTHPVATKLGNAWGLFDTIGNVWEWTHDGYVGDLSTVASIDPVVDSPDGLRVMRGGSYNCIPAEVRLAHRSGLPDTIAGLNVGLRCARSL